MDAPFPAPLVEQPGVATLLIRLRLALHVAHAHPGNLCGFDPGQFLGHGFQNHVLQFHHPLHLSGGYRLTGFHSVSFLPAWPGPDNSRVHHTGQLTCYRQNRPTPLAQDAAL